MPGIRICESLFLARYIEKFDTGTLMMIRESLAHALPEPEFVQRAGELVTTVWRDWLTEKVVKELSLNERQMQALNVIKSERQLTNTRYQQITGAGRPTGKRDLEDLVSKGVLVLSEVGRGAVYRVPTKRLKWLIPTLPVLKPRASNEPHSFRSCPTACISHCGRCQTSL